MIDFNNSSFIKLSSDDSYAAMVTDLLVPNEGVVCAFRGIRDGVVFTDKRIIAVNVQGLTGKKKDYTSLPYSKITAFSVETAGTFDLDAELDLWFSGLGKVHFEFRGKTNIQEISQIIARYALE